MSKYLDATGISHLWQKIVALVNYPSDDGTYMLKVENGVYTWVASGSSSSGTDTDSDSTVGSISGQTITLDSTLASGEYTLKYEDDTNTPLEDWDVIGTITQE